MTTIRALTLFSATVWVDNGSGGFTQTGAGSGAQTFNNIGIGTGEIFKDIVGNDVNLRTIVSGPGISISTAGDEISISSSAIVSGYEDISTSTATNPDPNLELTDMDLDTGTLVNLTLANPFPSTFGIKKKIVVSRYTVGSSMILTISSFINGSSLKFTGLGHSASLIWTATGWSIDPRGAILQ